MQFLSATVLGVSTVYRVDDVQVDIVALSTEGEVESSELQKRLKKAYYKQSIFFVDDTLVKEELNNFSYLRLVSFKRAYPNILVVEVAEDAEVFATPVDVNANEYYILNVDGVILGKRGNYLNRVDGEIGEKNILLTGKRNGVNFSGEQCMQALFPFCQQLNTLLDGKIRANVLSIELVYPTSIEQQGYIRLSMREGVRIYLFNPMVATQEKTEKAVEQYFQLTDGQKMTGRIAVTDNANGLRIDYSPIDGFAS